MSKLVTLLACVCFLASSCMKDSQQKTKVGEFEVELLFEKDGCKIYRFYDGRTIYYSDCRGMIYEEHTTRNGKSTVVSRTETLNTGRN